MKPNFILVGGEEIVIDLPEEPEQLLQPQDIPLDIKFEDDYLLVVSKPPGMVTHPARGHREGTLVNALLYHTTRLSPVGGDTRPGIVHRLDMETSGLLVVAKTERSHILLADMIQKKEVRRQYRAIIWGHPDAHLGTIEGDIGHNPKDHRKMAVVDEGKYARTDYQVRAYYDFLTDVKIMLHTGRTHQIRVHFMNTGHPVFGDPDYGGRDVRLGGIAPEYRREAQQLLKLIDRQALHAERLEFVHPITGEKLSIADNLPPDMQVVIDRLEKGTPI